MASEKQLARAGGLAAGVSEAFFGVEQSLFSFQYLRASVLLLKFGLIPLALAAFGLSIAPIRAAIRESASVLSHVGQVFRRRKSGH